MDVRHFLLLVVAGCPLVLAGCAGMGTTPGPPAAAPTFQTGDRWVYRVQDGFRQKMVWEETHEVTAASSQGITVLVSYKGSITGDRTETWSAPGVVRTGSVYDIDTRRFEPPLIRYKYPLTGGERWSQRMRDLDRTDVTPWGGIDRSVHVGGYEKVTVPAGTFDAIRLMVYMRLDDETFWRYPTDCTYTLWYSPALGVTVREEKYAYYSEKGGLNGGGRLDSQRAVVELISTTRR
jgi:hypothetical protein